MNFETRCSNGEALNFRSSGPCSFADRCMSLSCVPDMGKVLNSHLATLHPGVQLVIVSNSNKVQDGKILKWRWIFAFDFCEGGGGGDL